MDPDGRETGVKRTTVRPIFFRLRRDWCQRDFIGSCCTAVRQAPRPFSCQAISESPWTHAAGVAGRMSGYGWSKYQSGRSAQRKTQYSVVPPAGRPAWTIMGVVPGIRSWRAPKSGGRPYPSTTYEGVLQKCLPTPVAKRTLPLFRRSQLVHSVNSPYDLYSI
jgi:hypothetical protein